MTEPPAMTLEPWDAGLARRLPEVTLVGTPSAELATDTVALLRRYGFAIISSPPAELDPVGIAARSEQLLDLGRALGRPIVQSPRNELVEDVKDYSDVEAADDRGYRSGGELAPHSDPPTLIMLHCLRPARSGGETSLVNVAAIVGRLSAERPDLVDELFAPLPMWRVAGQYGLAEAGPSPVPQPVLARHDGVLSCMLYRPYIEQAAAVAGPALTADQVGALDAFERWSTSEQLGLRFVLGPGQTVVLHNRSVLHARTDFQDWPEMERRRHLLRLWVDAPDRLPVHPDHELGDFFATPPVG